MLTFGCAVHYFDEETGTEHLWGVGHMQMRVAPPEEEVRAVVGQMRTLGLSVGQLQNNRHLALGWHSDTRLYMIDDDTSVRFEWPTSRLFNVRVGSEPPWARPNEEQSPLLPSLPGD